MIVAASAVVVLAIGLAIAAGGSPRPDAAVTPVVAPVQVQTPPKLEPAVTLDELLSRVRDLRQSDLLFERRSDILGLLKEAAGRSGPRLEEVDQIAAEYDRKFEQAAARLADFTRSEAMRMAAKQKYAEAIERLDGYPPAFLASKSAEPLRVLRQDLERRKAEAGAPAASQAPRQVVGTPRWRS
jgi:hypothetical protein